MSPGLTFIWLQLPFRSECISLRISAPSLVMQGEMSTRWGFVGNRLVAAYAATRVMDASAVDLRMDTSTSQYSFCGSTGVGSSAQLQPARIPE